MLGPLREGIMTILIVAGPIILAAAAVGLLIGILQAATQVQDQTIPSAVKLIGVMILLVVIGFWMFSYLTRFTEKTIGQAFSMVMQNRDPISYSDEIKADETGNPPNIGSLEDTSAPPLGSPFGGLGAVPSLPSSRFGNSSGQLGQFSSNSGSFQPSVAPPMQAFSNAMQTQSNPTSEFPSYSSNYSGGSPNNYNSPTQSFGQSQGVGTGQNGRQLSYGGGPYGYNNGYNQSMPSEAYSYSSPTQADSRVYANPSNSFPQEYLNNNYSSINLPPPSSVIQSAKTPSSSSTTPTNKVVLKSTKSSEKKNKVMASAPEPVKIFRPKLPGSSDSNSSSENPSPYSSSENTQGDSIPSPYSSSKTNTRNGLDLNRSDVNWW
ncbi:MAG: flagellar biosynthetic protein FliQ [Candidatus Caenarcaniphilales bacterium]|nr:flagellar biosynthetic protein FliQ [Candidatus Caenarcaniphilales bacterium]